MFLFSKVTPEGPVRLALISPSHDQWRVGKAELSASSNELGLPDGGGSYVAVVGACCLAGFVPRKQNLAAGEAQWIVTIVTHGWCARHADLGGILAVVLCWDIGDAGVAGAVSYELAGLGVVGIDAVGFRLIHYVEIMEVLPHHVRIVLGEATDLLRQESPVTTLEHT